MLSGPRVFIGSSSESLPIAQQAQYELHRTMEPVLWNQGVFHLGMATLDSLLEELQIADFAVLVLSPDDLTTSRSDQHQTPRDNVVFELGLFMGALGPSRAFVLYDSAADLKLLSDLSGITKADYDGNWAKSNLPAAIGTACNPIRQAIFRHPAPLRAYPQMHFDGRSWSTRA